MKHIKLVSVGDVDEITDKQLILLSYTQNKKYDYYDKDCFIPTVFDNYSSNVTFEDMTINLQLWSTQRQENYKKLRPLSYPQTDIFLICFSLVYPSSLESVENEWLPEIREHCPGTPFILVGTRSDYRDEFDQHAEEYKARGWEPIAYEKGLEMKNKLGGNDYIECSTRTFKNITKVFEAAMNAVIHPQSISPQTEPTLKKKKSGIFKLFSKKKKKSEEEKKQKDADNSSKDKSQKKSKIKKKDSTQKDSKLKDPSVSNISKSENQKDSNSSNFAQKDSNSSNFAQKDSNSSNFAQKDSKPSNFAQKDSNESNADASNCIKNTNQKDSEPRKTDMIDTSKDTKPNDLNAKKQNLNQSGHLNSDEKVSKATEDDKNRNKTQPKCNFLDLADFQLICLIGNGAFSNVWKAKDKRTNKFCAAKILKFLVDEETRDSENTRSTFREVNLMSLLNHPSILKFIGYSPVNFENDPSPTIIIDYASNGSLRDIIDNEKKGLSPAEWNFTKKQTTIYGIAAGLQYIHAHKVIHRDLKPDNIMMDEYLNPKIGDFGLSKIIDSISVSLNMVSKSGMKGTPLYMAPEVLTDELYSEKSDVYSFAMIVYEIFSYEQPFVGFSINNIIQKVANQGYRPQIDDDVPDVYKNLIEACWQQNPDDRPSFEEIVEEMKNNQEFITDMTDEADFLDFVDFIENSQCSFDIKNQLMHFDEFIKANGRNKDVPKIKINENE